MEINLEAKTFELDDDPDSWTRLNIDDVPVCVSFGKIGKSYVVDATQEEELCVSVRLTVAGNNLY
jgi:exosome complex RNA-binding protein Rrp42 (RNase PH superfamily)